ncbi:MAG: response regulator [Verrucomicrobiota bacterium]
MPIDSESGESVLSDGLSPVDISITRVLVLASGRGSRAQELASYAGRLGHDARVVDSGEECFWLVGTNAVDVLVLYVELEEMAAAAAYVKRLEAEHSAAGVYVMAVLEGADDFGVQTMLEAGARDVLLWPGEREALTRRLRVADEAVRRTWARRRRADEMGRAERRLEGIFHEAPCGILVLRDEDGRILMANTRSEGVLGISREKLAGGHLSMLFPELFVNRQGALSLDGWVEERRALEMVYRHPEGEVRELELLATPISWDGKQELMIQVTDVAVRKEMERERIKASKAESISQLAGGVAHDFNNVLTAVSGNIALLNADEVYQTPESRELLNRAEAACEKARALANQLATFARQGGHATERVALDVLLRKSVRFSLFGGETIPHFHLAEDLWTVYGDEGELSQVVAGIVINADEAMASRGGGGGHLHVTASNLAVREGSCLPLAAGDYVRVCFKDNGSGMEAADMQRIFDPYFTTKPGHSGLGLATAASVVRGHRGYIRAESVRGQGALIEVYLPALSEPDLFCENVEAGTGEGSESVPGPPVRVLFMDDDEEVREVVDKILTRHGFEVYCARDGREAIEVFEKAHEFGDPFEVLLFDLEVRDGVGGKEAIQYLRRQYPDIRALVCTGYSDERVLENHREAGFTGVITKPFRIGKLVAAVSQMAPRRGAGQTPFSTFDSAE